MSNRTIRTAKKRKAFLAALRDGESIRSACEAAGFGRRSAYDWREDEQAFREEWDAAVEEGTDGLEDVAIQRAKDGSDTLMIFLLKARRPEKYKDRVSKEVSGPGGGPIEYSNLTEEELDARIAAYAAGAGEPQPEPEA